MVKVKILCTEMSGTGISGKLNEVIDVQDSDSVKHLIEIGWLALETETETETEVAEETVEAKPKKK